MIALHSRKCLFNLKWKIVYAYLNLLQIAQAIREPYKEPSFCPANLSLVLGTFSYRINSNGRQNRPSSLHFALKYSKQVDSAGPSHVYSPDRSGK